MRELLIFTPVLHGPHNSVDAPDGQIHCSVHVGVRLTPNITKLGVATTLAEFPTLVDWPANIPEISIQVGTGTAQSATLAATVVGFTPSTASAPVTTSALATASALWKQVFPPSTLVSGYQPPPPLPEAANDVWFDAVEMTKRIQTHYTTAAQTYIQPTKATLLPPRPIQLKPEPIVEKTGAFRTMEFLAGPPPPDPVMEGAKNFFNGPKENKPGTTLPNVPPPTPPPPDFHDVLGYLHQTPAALRALGLILDIVAPWPAGITQGPIESITLQVKFPAGTTPQATPEVWTPTVSYPAVPSRADGFEDPSGLQLIPFDPLHAAHVYSRNTSEDLHALRSSGMSLMRTPATDASGKPASASLARIRTQMSRMSAYSPLKPFDLGLNDLVAGHRIDVWDGKAWRSLCQVTGSATRNGAALPFDSEGILSSSVAVDPGGNAVRANDTLAYWNGWSLCATRPGYVTEPAAASTGSTAGVQISRSAKPGTLPTLRFGRQYAFRARLVDIAGNSLPPDPAPTGTSSSTGPADPAALAPVQFLRLEPVGSPAMVFAAQPPGPGESSTQIVVRTAAPVAQPATKAVSPHGITYTDGNALAPASSMRYILPPETTVETAERHGVFDSSPGVMSAASFSMIKAGSLWNASQPTTQFPLKADVFSAQIYPGGPPVIPYLPDPACEGVTVIALDNGSAIGVDNGAAKSSSFRAGTAYPGNYSPKSLNLIAGAPGSAGSITSSQQGVEITLPPGERVAIGLASTLTPEGAQAMGLAQWAQAGMSGVTHTNYMQSMQAGLVTAVTPNRQISLIHAVQQPLTAPVISKGAFNPQAQNDTVATITYEVSYDAKSTSTVTVEAAWTEWVDHGPGTDPPASHSMTAHLDTFVVPGPTQPLSNSYVFGDTKARSALTLSAIATSAFTEFFPAGTDCTIPSLSPVPAPRLATAPPSTPRLAYAIPTFKWTRTLTSAEGPYVSTRLGNALRIYLERPWYTSGDLEMLAVVFADPQRSTTVHSQWGADPLSATTPPTASNSAFQFLPEAGSQTPVSAVLPATAESVMIMPFPVEYDALTDRYFSDVIFDPATFGGAYKPFVQLEIAAYQANAIAGCQLSSTVIVPFTQIFPDRTLTVNVALTADNPLWAPGVTAVLKGVGPQAASPAYTSDLGRGIRTQIDMHFIFNDVYSEPSPVPANPTHPSSATPGSGGENSGALKKVGTTRNPDGSYSYYPGPPSLTGQVVALPSPCKVELQQFGIDEAGSAVPINLGVGHGWQSVDITVNEWELMSPDQQLLTASQSGTASVSLPSGIPDSSAYTEYGFVGPLPRPGRLVYTETISLQSGWKLPGPGSGIDPLPPGLK